MHYLTNTIMKLFLVMIFSSLSISCVVSPRHHPRSVIKHYPVEVVKRHIPRVVHAPVYRRSGKVFRKSAKYQQRSRKHRSHSKGWTRL